MKNNVDDQQDQCLRKCGSKASKNGTNGLCFNCYRQSLKNSNGNGPECQQKQEDKPKNSKSQTGDDGQQDSSSPTCSTKRKRCAQCHVKLPLIPMECRCGKVFCKLHRYAAEHQCTFNYRKMAAKEIEQNNPKIEAQKLRKI
ncbi:Zinc finger A20 and AN1 domain-containing stress-associated protein 6 [Trichinella pseudospiralis]|uniref:Zinc finger A20 and AN1 domain-containing stress-associated protein 6 n=1 Tax=Trichinella pseudospiralis TaxID=6337 RepID=A0A0V1F0Y4_TRIPS|nr:Zinc finger A20 and AN1 domain-containing stress-associated protein 6 [Trichinella pseudospiralis]KRY79718.1 Zinc finger A20 and AN1 domain-containing stress-associated protein 6 [Trichinella pseudospiralis]KRY90863.1 Zinc finger A20 and AN1 domain-containing stress-associated protein 6 [Trichinella pseudospiralis]